MVSGRIFARNDTRNVAEHHFSHCGNCCSTCLTAPNELGTMGPTDLTWTRCLSRYYEMTPVIIITVVVQARVLVAINLILKQSQCLSS